MCGTERKRNKNEAKSDRLINYEICFYDLITLSYYVLTFESFCVHWICSKYGEHKKNKLMKKKKIRETRWDLYGKIIMKENFIYTKLHVINMCEPQLIYRSKAIILILGECNFQWLNLFLFLYFFFLIKSNSELHSLYMSFSDSPELHKRFQEKIDSSLVNVTQITDLLFFFLSQFPTNVEWEKEFDELN